MNFKIETIRHGLLPVTEHVYKLKQIDLSFVAPQKSAEWFSRRRNYLTASSISSACSKNPYESRKDLMLKKLYPTLDVFTGNKATEHGQKYEQEAIELYEKQTGEKVIEFGLLESLRPNESFLAGSPDGITSSGILIEVKCPYRRIPIDEVPKHYMYQIQMLMHILLLSQCHFIQYSPETVWQDKVLIITKVDYDPIFWAKCKPLITSFWCELNEHKKQLELNGDLPDDLTIVPIRKRTIFSKLDIDKNNIKKLKQPISLTGCNVDIEKEDVYNDTNNEESVDSVISNWTL